MEVKITFNNSASMTYRNVDKIERRETFVWIRFSDKLSTLAWPWRVIDAMRVDHES